MQLFSFPQIDAKHHLHVPCYLYLRSVWNLWNSSVTLRNLFCRWGNWSPGVRACGCSVSLIRKLSFLLGRSDTFVEEKGVLPKIGFLFVCLFVCFKNRVLAQGNQLCSQGPSSGSTIIKSHERVINHNYSVPSEGRKTVNFHLPQPEPVLNISTLCQRSRGQNPGKRASEMLADTMKWWMKWWRWNSRKWTGNKQDCWGQVKQGWPPLQTFWGVIINEPQVSPSCSYH